jgi:hypothetical protein
MDPLSIAADIDSTRRQIHIAQKRSTNHFWVPILRKPGTIFGSRNTPCTALATSKQIPALIS